jgi:2-amino-4-hydroxy-6-hydroxymethyldihydropteridine diphosphokinase
MNRAYLLIGGNIGNRIKNIEEAVIGISLQIGEIITQSSLYESEPWGFEHAQNFINQVLQIETSLDANSLLETVLKIEKELGRTRSDNSGYQGRTIDIDILFFNDEIINSDNLIIPHPHLHKRMFTLLPLAEMSENMIHPTLNKSIKELIIDCTDEVKVWRYKA